MSGQEWEARLAAWGSPPSQTEQDKCDNAVRAVRRAIERSAALQSRHVTVSAQGSYQNRTNVRADSDVDIRVTCSDTFFFDLPPGATRAQFGIGPAPGPYTFDQFRADVAVALTDYFGAPAVREGRKAFDVRENTNRIAADVVPSMLYRQFRFGLAPIEGTAFLSQGRKIVNFPEQHYDNGVAKNRETGRRFKAITRILKHLRYEMLGGDFASAGHVQSFELESMVWNVPTAVFGVVNPLAAALYPTTGIREPLKAVCGHLYTALGSDESCAAWTEVNGIKPLFGAAQPWSRESAQRFIVEAYTHAELNR